MRKLEIAEYVAEFVHRAVRRALNICERSVSESITQPRSGLKGPKPTSAALRQVGGMGDCDSRAQSSSSHNEVMQRPKGLDKPDWLKRFFQIQKAEEAQKMDSSMFLPDEVTDYAPPNEKSSATTQTRQEKAREHQRLKRRKKRKEKQSLKKGIESPSKDTPTSNKPQSSVAQANDTSKKACPGHRLNPEAAPWTPPLDLWPQDNSYGWGTGWQPWFGWATTFGDADMAVRAKELLQAGT